MHGENHWLVDGTGKGAVASTPETGGGAAGDERNFFAMAETEDGLDFGGGVAEDGLVNSRRRE